MMWIIPYAITFACGVAVGAFVWSLTNAASRGDGDLEEWEQGGDM